MEHLFELVTELLFGFAKHTPDKMPDDITYNPKFIVKHPIKKNIARIIAPLIIIITFSLLWMMVKNETRYLFVIFVVLGFALLVLSLISFFNCSCMKFPSNLPSSELE